MALATTLYIAHGKAKTKTTEVANALGACIGRVIPIEWEWKFVDQAPFKKIAVDEQKRILVDVLGHNLSQMMLNPTDSLTAAFAASPPVRDLVFAIAKIVVSFDYDSTLNSPIGAPFLHIFVGDAGKSLVFKLNLNAVQLVNNGDWGVFPKLLALVGAAVTVVTSSPAPMVAMAPSPMMPPMQQPVMVSPPPQQYGPIQVQTPPPQTVVTAPPQQMYQSVQVTAPPMQMAPPPQPAIQVVQAVPQPVLVVSTGSPKYPRVGGKSGGNGSSTFLYLTVDKVKKRAVEIGAQLSARLGAPILFEADVNSLIKDFGFTKESEADQKGLLTGPVMDTMSAVAFAATNGLWTVEQALRAQPGYGGISSVKVCWAPSVTPTVGWAFVEVVSTPPLLTLKCAISAVDENYGTVVVIPNQVVMAPPQQVLVTPPPQVIATPPPVMAPSPVISHPPVVAQPQLMIPPPVVISPPAVAPVVSAPVVPAQPTHYVRVGGNPGGNGTASFLYSQLEKFKKFAADNFCKDFQKALGSSRVSVVLDHSFARQSAWTKYSEADQKGFISGPMMDNIVHVLFKAANGDHLAALFLNPAFAERCAKINKINIVYTSGVHSAEGFPGTDIQFHENGTELSIRTDIDLVDVYYDPVGWSISRKAMEAIAGVEQKKAEAARQAAERQAVLDNERAEAERVAEAARMAAEQERALQKAAEQEKARLAMEADAAERVQVLEDAGVTMNIRLQEKRLNDYIQSISGPHLFTYDVDNSFIHDKKLRWRDCGTQKTTLKAISVEEFSLFRVLTDAFLLLLESGAVAVERFFQTYQSVVLRFELPDGNSRIPRFVVNASSRTLEIWASFSNLYDPRNWKSEFLQGIPEASVWQGTEITEILKAYLAHLGGWLEDMARDESWRLLCVAVDPYFDRYLQSRRVPIEVDWKSLDDQTASSPPIIRLKQHYKYIPCVLRPFFDSLGLANSVVMEIVNLRLVKIRIVASGSDHVQFDEDANKQATMTIVYKYATQSSSEKYWKQSLEDQVRGKSDGIRVRNVEAEIAIAEAHPTVSALNIQLCRGYQMNSGDKDKPVLLVDYPSFVDTPECGRAFGPSQFKVLHTTNLNTIAALVRGFERVGNTELGGPLLKTMKCIRVTLDVKSRSKEMEPVLTWDDPSKTFTVTHNFTSFEHPDSYDYAPRIEFITGILVESCRIETKNAVAKFYTTVRNDFGRADLPVLIDESYQQSKEFVAIHPSKMKAIVIRMFTTLPRSIFHGDMGIRHCSEFPRAKKIMHDKVKMIRLLPDGCMASDSSSVALTPEGELVVRVSFDCKDWTTPIGYRISELIESRPMIEQEVIEESDAKIAAMTSELQAKAGHPKLNIVFDWKALQADGEFQGCQTYVNTYCRYVVQKIRTALEGSPAVFDKGLLAYVKEEGLAPHLKDISELVFQMSTLNQVNSKGKYGLFTPYYYDVTQQKNVISIRFNFAPYPVGLGSSVEWVLHREGALKRQALFIDTIAQRNYEEELARREQAIADTIADNDYRQRRYESDVDTYNRDMQTYNNTPAMKKCGQCSGKGYWGSGHQCGTCSGSGQVQNHRRMPNMPTAPMPTPIPVFNPTSPADFRNDQNRGELRTGHFVEGTPEDPVRASGKH